MKARVYTRGFPLLLALLLASCGDKELEAKSREQQARIVELQTEVDLLTARLGPEVEGHPEEELEKVRSDLEAAQERVEALKEELAQATDGLAEAEKEFKDYKRDYPIPE